ncbi:MAG: hypothetical protein V4534_03005 [Myxococcota bacterium]
MANLVFLMGILGSVISFAGDSWKVAGEHFENQYLSDLQEKLNESDLGSGKPLSVLPLKQAFLIYQIEAMRGDVDAQFRLGALYEQSSLKQESEKWYKLASAGGHEYATYRLGKNIEPVNEDDDCLFYGNKLLGSRALLSVTLFHVESLAILGHGHCRIALGRHKKSPYWLRSSVFTPSTTVVGGRAFYHLGLALEESLGSDHKSVISSMERAAVEKSENAREWLESRRTQTGLMAYALFSQANKDTLVADHIFKVMIHEPKEHIYMLWGKKDRYQSGALRDAIPLYNRDIKAALYELPNDKPPQLIFEVIQELSTSLKSEFIDCVLSLYQELDGFKAPDRKALENTLTFLKSPEGLKVDKAKRFKLIENSARVAHLGLNQDLVQYVTSLTKDLNLQQLENALNLRHFLASSLDVTELDFALDRVLEHVPADQTTLSAVLKIAKDSRNLNLLAFCFPRLFANELEQADALMYFEDLLHGAKSTSQGRRGTHQIVKMLAQLPVAPDSELLESFPKLKMLRDSGISSTGAVGRIDVLKTYAKALQDYEACGYYFWDNTLASTLAPRHISAIRSSSEFTLSRLSSAIHDFEKNRASMDYLGDAQISRKMAVESLENGLTLKNYELEYRLAELKKTQSSFDAHANYIARYSLQKEQLRTSAGLKVFKSVPENLDVFHVSSANSKMSPDSKSLGDLPFYAHHSIKLRKGEVLNVQVAGEWSPVCALKRSGHPIDIARIRMGSEGFREQQLSGNSRSTGSDQRETMSKFSTESATTSFGLSGSGGAYGLGFSASFSSQKTTGTSQTSDNSQYQQTSQYQSNAAAFQSGMRFEDTPFPRFPAGAYLAIVTPTEIRRNTEIIYSSVVQTHTSVVASEDAVVYFVVNDCKDETSNSHALTINWQKLEPTNIAISALLDNMEDQLRLFSRRGEALVQEGGDLGLGLEMLKSNVIAELKKNQAINFMSDPTLYAVFGQWLNHEAVQIVRKAKIIELTRKIYALKFESDSLKRQLDAQTGYKEHLLSRQSRLVKTGRHIPLFHMVVKTIREATRFLLPILRLYHADKIASEIEIHNGDVDLETMAIKAKFVVEQVLSHISADAGVMTGEEIVVIRIPRPNLELDEREKILVPTISKERAKIFWDHLFIDEPNVESLGLKLEPEDLYQSAVALGMLSRHDGAPVIVDMALLFGHSNTLVGSYLKEFLHTAKIDMQVGYELDFPSEFGSQKWTLGDDKLRSHPISLGFINIQQLMADVTEYMRSDVTTGRNTGKGLSPFTSYNFALKGTGTLTALARDLPVADDAYPEKLTDIFLVMKVVSNRCGKPIK